MPLGQSGQRARRRAARTPTVPPADPSVLHEVAFSNTSASSSTGLVKFGLAFEKTDVPSGQIPKVRIKDGADVRGWPIETATWSDGSLRKATMVADIGTVPGSSTVTIEVYNDTGSVTASSLVPATYVAGLANDHTIDVTSRTGSTTGSMSDLAYSLKTASAVSTKRETQADTDLFVRYFCWEKLAGEEHLVCLNYLDIWLDTDGSTVIAHEWVPVLSQHWWVNDPEGVEQAKEKYTYDAAVKVGASAIDTRTALAHAYYCRWASLYSADDAQHATPHWIDAGSTTKPTLSIAYSVASRKRMARVGGYVPPLAWGDTDWTIVGSGTYTPLGVNDHRSIINNVGAYNGRGQITRFDANAIATQTASNWRIARVSAHAGLSMYDCVYDHRVIDSEASPRLIPQKVTGIGAQTYSGMEAETLRARGTDFDSGTNLMPQDVPGGGTGAFSSFDNDHAVPYAAFMAFVTGERYLADAQICCADLSLSYAHMNIYAHNPSFDWALSITGNAIGVPSTPRRGAIPRTGGVRGRAWAGNQMFWSWAVCSDANPNKAYLAKALENYDDFLDASYDYFSSDHKAYGGWIWPEPQQSKLWMHNWCSMIFGQWKLHSDDMGFGDGFNKIATMSTKIVLNGLATDRIGVLGSYIYTVPCAPGPRPSGATAWITGETAVFSAHDATWSGNTYTIASDANYPIANGDRCILTATNNGDGTSGLTWPTELSWATIYYLVNVSGSTFELSSTLGGSAITLSGSGTTVCSLDKSSYDVEVSPSDAGGDTYSMICMAAIVAAYLDGTQGITLADVTRYKEFMSTSTRTTFAPWNYSEDQS